MYNGATPYSGVAKIGVHTAHFSVQPGRPARPKLTGLARPSGVPAFDPCKAGLIRSACGAARGGYVPGEPFRSRPARAINLSDEGTLVEQNALLRRRHHVIYAQPPKRPRPAFQMGVRKVLDQDQSLSAPREN